jgi:nucleoside-diphosphate-sugar epimerase
MANNELVLVTGGSGFIGAHCILVLLREGYRVRTTVRSLKRSDEVRSMLQAGGVTEEQAKSVEFCEADLSDDKGWPEACKDCTYVLHVASPFPASAPKHENDLIIPAKEGTLRALKAAKAAGSVKRVVVTSSMAAIGKFVLYGLSLA